MAGPSESTCLRQGAASALALVLLLGAAACSGRPDAGNAGAEPAAAIPSDDAIASMIASWTGDLDGMVQRRYIRVLVTLSKTNYFLDGAEQHGATYDAGKLFETFVNQQLKTGTVKVQVVFIPVRRDRIIQALLDGVGDIAAASLTVTPARQAQVAFAAPFVRDVREVVVTSDGQPPVTTLDDLAGRAVHVRRSSSYYEHLADLNEARRKAGRPPVRIVETDEQLEDEDVLEMVNGGLIPATVVDDHVARLWSQVFDHIRVEPVSVHDGGAIAWAVRPTSPELLASVNAFAAKNPKGTLTYNMVLARYFKDTKWVTNAASAVELEKFRRAIDLFRRYGDQYEFPWLLVAAQAYQESTIDQSRRSAAGAVGVMQIKPSTAEGPPINITGVDTSIDRNIEAGVKYLRFIVDRYYKDEPMDRLNRALFAVASYNAGPARVSQLRRKAERMGLDPNVWFGNVEVVAAREIGRETVQYVANIYKYYVSYQLIAQQMEARRRAAGK